MSVLVRGTWWKKKKIMNYDFLQIKDDAVTRELAVK